MHVIFNSKERTLREMTDIALSAGWQVTGVIRKPEGSLFCSIIAIPASPPPPMALLSPFAEREIIERSNSPVGHTFYSRSRLPSPKGAAVAVSQSDSAVCRMMKRLRKQFRRRSAGAGKADGREGREGDRSRKKSASV